MEDIRISVLSRLIKNGEISCEDIETYVLENLYKHNPALNAFVRIEEGFIRYQFDALKAKSKELPLYGIPIAIKDNICIHGVETTCASHILQGFVSPYNATVIEKLISNGAILVPNANMDEFAMGSSTETSYFAKACNPWNREYVPGGSSGGSCSAVAARMVSGALGSDTGGSIRQPASFCGVVGMKPTYGRVSRYGLVAFASSLDQIGPIGVDVRDTALLLKIIAGYDPKDSTSINIPVPNYEEFIGQDIRGIKIGVPEEYFIEGLDQEVKKSVLNVVNKLEEHDVQIEEISLPHTEYAVATYYIIATAEASSNLARYDGVQYGLRSQKIENLYELYSKTRAEGFGQEVKRRIILGTYVLSAGYYEAYYLKAQKVRSLIRQDFKNAFEKVDIIITPTSPTPPFRLGEKLDDPLQMYLSDIFTISVNLSGLPAISIPVGFSQGGLPIGLQLIGKPFKEQELFKIGYVCESVSDWDLMRRPL